MNQPGGIETRDTLGRESLKGSLGFLLRVAQLRSFGHFFAVLGEENVRPGEVTVLDLVRENPGIRQGVVSKTLKIKRAQMSKMVREMEANGLVARRVPPEDRRSVELRLTPAGEAQMDHIATRFPEIEERIGKRLTPAEARELRRLLIKMTGLEDKEGD
ncbi:transcriptional regulator, MarR family [Pseudooceanicola antarcticus]|uniref:MarR family transcriptional regulator n=1 Tax=Pseudooceanicola antarcticus TaxID=1247613 RepID=A0A285JH12_9RHOB|nr:MarR family transcriptional regulator [Pseudooceanicola antarcticus]PJE26442.1 MarR family transcriptional regulator [Pseudooceanicola antarcticus]SNY59562.1 transcriptional regulator, MarR family [Pseudooceanicola antarcticus]